jgi:hypothetical protein
MSAAKRESPSAERNKGHIWDILSSKVFSRIDNNNDNSNKYRILEIAAGCGAHTDHFCKELKLQQNIYNNKAAAPFVWYPSDPGAEDRASIQAYIQDGNLGDVVQTPLPLTLDTTGIVEPETASLFTKEEESSPPLDLILCINMIHISPWEATLGLMKLAGEQLADQNNNGDGGVLYCYGPYKVGGTAVESNL